MNDYSEDFEIFCAMYGVTEGVTKEILWEERVSRGCEYSEYPNPQNIPRRTKSVSDYSDVFEKFCFEKGYAGDVFKDHLWEVWSAAVKFHTYERDLMNEAAQAVLRFSEPTCMNDEKWRDRLEAMSTGEPG